MAEEAKPIEGEENEEKDAEEIEEEETDEKEDEEEEDKEKEDKGKKTEKKEELKFDDEPPSRKSVKDYIIERKNKKIEKLSKKDEDDDEEEEDDDDDEEDLLQPEAKKAIKKESRRIAGPILNHIKSESDERELRNFLNDHPEAKPFEAGIRKYMAHKAYQEVPVEFIYAGLAAKLGKLVPKTDNLEKKKKEMDKEDKESELGGSQRRPGEKGKYPDFNKMTDKEFEAWDKKHGRG
jgi:hypothetical protein